MNKRSIGKVGEEYAIQFLKKKDYQILDTNYLKRTGEIDIVAFDPTHKEYVFVEVKTRKNTHFGYPEEFVDDQKVEKITATAHLWLTENKIDQSEWRIDVIALVKDAEGYLVEHIENF